MRRRTLGWFGIHHALLLRGPIVRVPDFFIIGAPKCGTNALYDYLRAHPNIYMPELKEPQYFCKDFPGLAQVSSFEEYCQLFSNAPKQSRVGEASVWYLYSKVAVPKIMTLNPSARFIAVLRNPIDVANSLHSQFVRLFKEDADDFETAWAFQEARQRGERLPRYCPEAACLQYKAVCSFSEQIERLKSYVPDQQIKVLIYEELFADIKNAYEAVLSFIGVPSDGRQSFHVANENQVVRSRVAVRALRLGTRILPNRFQELRRFSRALGLKPLRLLSRYNSKPAPRPPLHPAFRRQLAAEFAGEVRRLEGVLGRSVACWDAPPEAPAVPPLTAAPAAASR